MSAVPTVTVVIASPLEAEHVATIRAVDEHLEVLYEPDLLATPRYVSDHGGELPELTAEQDRRWHEMLARAEVSFDFDRREPTLAEVNFPRLRWVQATSAGVGQVVPRFSLDLSRVVVTTAAGVHAVPLAEFAVASLLHFAKGFPQLRAWQQEHRWTRYTSRNLAGQRVLVVGLGSVGRAVAAKLAALDVHVTAAVRPGGTSSAPGVGAAVAFSDLHRVLPDMDGIVLACPLTSETENLVDAAAFAAMKAGAVLVNVARGQVVDEEAMTSALADGRLGGAALDVASQEPLPPTSPLWDSDRVVISPHSASTVASENALVTDLFCRNLRRWLDGEPLINVYDPERGY
ncbi:D-2-hydroxyacid dehydrogenase [Microlunatus flavus]|uniref:Phosphoglycerate dehydrogenase n=1 Tax=Microlunatus flavus TaxID=1036181 RepID=A0A1H9L0N1_9ACTN|nr:D-2-hydroxyacid dehydrogenase [Microlunatus flavus]SER04725.1 Phosphoglycerate dehydrogenase [Microlunatus flavus]